MKIRLTAIAATITLLATGPAMAGGAGGCSYGSKWQQTSVEPQEQTEASKKLASLNAPTSDQEAAAEASTGAQTTTTSK